MRSDQGAVLGSVEELLRSVEDRQPLDSVGKSGARLERVLVDGAAYVVKHLDRETDWTMRASGFDGFAPVELWRRGVLDALPDCIRQPIVAVAEDRTAALLMDDVSAWLVPATDEVVPADQHATFLDHMAQVHAAFWDTGLDIDVVTPAGRYLELSPAMAEAELARGSDDLVPQLVRRGWPLFEEVAPAAAAVVVPLVHEPAPLVDALATTPQTFVHGNWKLDNLGTDDRGRTVLIDWEIPGRAAPLSDLAWYLAINCRRLPVTKETAIDQYRAALERHGIATDPWWDRQLALCLLGALVQFGWEKALGGYDDELAWWEAHAVAGRAMLSP
ncbi:phosphotransferase [Nocardioides pocheonensis]|uniref:Aminoglycoside phosphotransferase n=1 Tax=Nocardioides pocheonensis TaxID=661485 RepID=A0A3N0GHW2_9ACTN|nr:phosphotransferase [Nocardioides pocheonensis]RNM11630.1 aminoglycoside phosphotransferase [Nocardioides pocheonensis]